MPVLTIYPGTSRERVFRWSEPRCDIGRAPSNALQLDEESVSSYHARIEQRGVDFWLVDLKSTNGSFVNGAPVREVCLQENDVIQLGDAVQLRYTRPPVEEMKPKPVEPLVEVVTEPVPAPIPTPAATPEETPTPAPMLDANAPVSQETALMPIGAGTAIAQRGVQCPSCAALIPFSVNFCPRCGFSLAQTAPLAFPMQPQPVGFVRPMEHPGGQSVGMFPLLALLCGVFGFLVVPSPLAVILGLLAVGQIRRHGGLESDRKQAMLGIFLGFFWIVVIIGVVGWWRWNSHRDNAEVIQRERRTTVDKQIAENEASIIDILKGIARAERLVKVVRLKDPNQTGNGQFMTLPELAEAGTSYFSRDLASGQSKGYKFSIRNVSEASYLAVGEPIQYNETGRRTFTIDAGGFVRGKDIEGKSFAQTSGALPQLSEYKSAFDEKEDDAIAKEAIAFARRLADEGKHDLCQQILNDIAAQFAMTTAAQELNALKKSVDPFIIEAQASSKHQKAIAAIAANDLKLAISILKEISELYPTYSKISTVTDDLTKHQTALIQKLEKEAKDLFDRAEACERDGKPADALKLYVEIEKNYPTTEWAKRIADQKPALQKSIREKAAEELFAQARNLAINTDSRDIVNQLQQLQRNYSETDYVKRNTDAINTYLQKAQAEQYRLLALEQMKAGRDADALARLEEACANNPDARPSFRDVFLQLYPRVARKRMDEGDARDALRLYTNYRMLEPATNDVNPAVFSKLQFVVAKAEFTQGRYLDALQLLISAKADYAKDPEFNDLYGSVEVARGNHLDSIQYFNNAIAAKPTTGNYYARRGYAQLLLALQIEQEAMIAYAGLLREQTNTVDAANAPAANLNIVMTPTGASNTPTAAATQPADDFAPVFATALPPTATGLKPEMQVRYDATAAQRLLDLSLEMLDNMSTTNANLRVRTAVRATGRGSRSNANVSNNGAVTNFTTGTDSGENVTQSARSERIGRIKTTAEFTKAFSGLRQRSLDCNKRRATSITAMTTMNLLFTSGNRDLATAIELKADRSPQLNEILKTTVQHEALLKKAVPQITTYLDVERDVLEKVLDMLQSVHRNMQVHTTAPMDPTATLEIYFNRWFNRSDFDKGVQSLREAGIIKVPLENYTILPPNTGTPPTPRPAAGTKPSASPTPTPTAGAKPAAAAAASDQ
jgi:pSer/pThr/pTyr-binding forkhead associated (FHA) protein